MDEFDVFYRDSLDAGVRNLERQRLLLGIPEFLGKLLLAGILLVVAVGAAVSVHNEGRPVYERKAHPDAVDRMLNRFDEFHPPGWVVDVSALGFTFALLWAVPTLLFGRKKAKDTYHARFRKFVLAPILGRQGIDAQGDALSEPFTVPVGGGVAKIGTIWPDPGDMDFGRRIGLVFELELPRSPRDDETAQWEQRAPEGAALDILGPKLTLRLPCPVVPDVETSIGDGKVAKEIDGKIRAALDFLRGLAAS